MQIIYELYFVNKYSKMDKGRMIQAEGIAGAKALRQEQAWLAERVAKT